MNLIEEVEHWIKHAEDIVGFGAAKSLIPLLEDVKVALEKGEESAIRLGELNIIRGITQTPNSTKEKQNEPPNDR